MNHVHEYQELSDNVQTLSVTRLWNSFRFECHPDRSHVSGQKNLLLLLIL